MAPFAITPNDPLTNFVLPILTALSTKRLEVWASKAGALLPEHRVNILLIKLWLFPGHIGQDSAGNWYPRSSRKKEESSFRRE